ncbi:MAG: lytic transglycosylase domain-containing protein, partial [Lysobacter sp.]
MSTMAVCITEAAKFYGAEAAGVATYVRERGGRTGEIRTLPNGDIEIGVTRIPGSEAKLLAGRGITERMLADDDCLNVAIATYLLQRNALTMRPAVQAAAPPRPQSSCMSTAAQRYHLPVPILQAVVKTEGGWDGLKKRNANGSYDLGRAQINTIHLAELAKYGISEHQLISD